MKNSKTKLILLLIVIILFSISSNTYCQEQESDLNKLETPAIKVIEKSIIENFTLIVFSDTIYYSLIGNDKEGIDNIRLINSTKIIAEKKCSGEKFCKISGNFDKNNLNSPILEGVFSSINNKTEKEKIKISSYSDGKVYSIANIYTGEEPISPPEPPKNVITETATEDNPTDYKITTQKSPTGYKILIETRDEDGINYIEVLEDNEFKDVMLCKGNKECSFELDSMNNKNKSSYLYTIKIRDEKTHLTVTEKTINY